MLRIYQRGCGPSLQATQGLIPWPLARSAVPVPWPQALIRPRTRVVGAHGSGVGVDCALERAGVDGGHGSHGRLRLGSQRSGAIPVPVADRRLMSLLSSARLSWRTCIFAVRRYPCAGLVSGHVCRPAAPAANDRPARRGRDDSLRRSPVRTVRVLRQPVARCTASYARSSWVHASVSARLSNAFVMGTLPRSYHSCRNFP